LDALHHTQLIFDLAQTGVYKESSPGYVAFEVTDTREALTRNAQAETVAFMLPSMGFADLVVHSLGLDTAKHVVLLDRGDWKSHEMLARGREIEGAIYEFWRRNDISVGRVEIV
jgi:hypothetical protein